MPLTTQLNLVDADGVYQMIVAAHRGLSANDSAALNARLVLLLANHIGDMTVLQAALTAAALPASPSDHQSPYNDAQ